jgi:hypothetical protein
MCGSSNVRIRFFKIGSHSHFFIQFPYVIQAYLSNATLVTRTLVRILLHFRSCGVSFWASRKLILSLKLCMKPWLSLSLTR